MINSSAQACFSIYLGQFLSRNMLYYVNILSRVITLGNKRIIRFIRFIKDFYKSIKGEVIKAQPKLVFLSKLFVFFNYRW